MEKIIIIKKIIDSTNKFAVLINEFETVLILEVMSCRIFDFAMLKK